MDSVEEELAAEVMTGVVLLRLPFPTRLTESIFQPGLDVLELVASVHRSRMVLPANLGVSVRLMMVSLYPLLLPVQASLPAKILRPATDPEAIMVPV